MRSRPPVRSNTLVKLRESSLYTLKWSLIAMIVGVAVGFAAVAFTGCLDWGIDQLASARATVWVYVLPVVGLTISGIITSVFAPEAAGHGTDAVIKAYNEKWGKAPLIVVPVKLIASVFTIAFGGSAGKEGPTVQMGGGIGYFIGKTLNLKLVDIRRIVVCGMGASFGSVFTAPVAGGIFGAEVLYRDDIEYSDLFVSFVSSITAYYVYAIMLGKTRLFKFPIPAGYTFVPTRDLLLFILTGVIVGLVSLAFIKALYGYEYVNEKLPLPPYARTALGGLFTGLTALIATPYVLGTGISLVEQLSHREVFSSSLLLLMLVGKIAATSFTIGSGGSGGVVAPSMGVGAITGTLLSQSLNYPYPIAVISACTVGLLGSAAHIPITTTVLAAEAFGMELILPATIVCFIASWISRGDTVYRESYVSRLQLSKATHHFEEQ
ncbi:MAG: chloride channel protein [Bacillota bacterium]